MSGLLSKQAENAYLGWKAEQAASHDTLVAAAERVWGWVGPGYPDLDNAEERDLFMRDVVSVAWAYFKLNHA